MLQNPIHLRLERLESWQHVTFMACLCERMYPELRHVLPANRFW
ncbi:DUF416 family protein [Shigella flexneri]